MAGSTHGRRISGRRFLGGDAARILSVSDSTGGHGAQQVATTAAVADLFC
jgi:hypothetical protein